jgi:hypothetical protein
MRFFAVDKGALEREERDAVLAVGAGRSPRARTAFFGFTVALRTYGLLRFFGPKRDMSVKRIFLRMWAGANKDPTPKTSARGCF